MKRLQERVVTAERLADEGATVLVTDVQDEAGEQTVAAIRDGGGDALYVHLGVTDDAGWRAAVERVLAERGLLDILVNNAGLGDLAPIEETSLSDWERTIALGVVNVGSNTFVPGRSDGRPRGRALRMHLDERVSALDPHSPPERDGRPDPF
jgi:NAD(P)-dependent dehydrogenase (short-subunit alcohol dehydrogenase family)